ncbi:MAG: NAD(P)/FAD-dependent oxidoreductase [Saprospiraceae bacterium]
MKIDALDLLVIGGGAAGFFCAINYAEFKPGHKITILEAGINSLSKVRISGGGRCNLTHACFDPREIVHFYPRGSKELLGPFTRFGVQETIEWFESHGVLTKTEEDGRMFPNSNSSETIISTFLSLVDKYNIHLNKGERVQKFIWEAEKNLWKVSSTKGEYYTRNLFVSSGSDQRIWNALAELNHKVISPVPSLFTFNTEDKNITELMGLSVSNASIRILDTNLQSNGALLITHWGFSGPATLKLSSWGARELYEYNYKFEQLINWSGEDSQSIETELLKVKMLIAKKVIWSSSLFNIPLRLWKYLCEKSNISPATLWADITNKQIKELKFVITEDRYRINGKSTFKQEFVTAGGVDLQEINFKKFESRKCSNLYLAGEVLNIDALTGGYNFQAAWTGAYIAAQSMALEI